MYTTVENYEKVKTTLYIDKPIKDRLDGFVGSRKKTEFINHAILQALELAEEENGRKKLKARMKNFKREKTKVKLVDLFRDIRKQGLDNE